MRNLNSFPITHRWPAQYADRIQLYSLNTPNGVKASIMLEETGWMVGGEYSIADIALIGWVRNLITFYEARELVGFDSLPHIATWLERSLARPAVLRGLEIPSR